MTLQSSGPIYLSQIAAELGISAIGLTLNDPRCRALAGKPTDKSAISLADFYGKSSISGNASKMFTSTTTWTSPGNGTIYVTGIGKGGKGGNGGTLFGGMDAGGGGGGGGGAGEFKSRVAVTVTTGQVVNITIDDTQTSFGTLVSFATGANGTYPGGTVAGGAGASVYRQGGNGGNAALGWAAGGNGVASTGAAINTGFGGASPCAGGGGGYGFGAGGGGGGGARGLGAVPGNGSGGGGGGGAGGWYPALNYGSYAAPVSNPGTNGYSVGYDGDYYYAPAAAPGGAGVRGCIMIEFS